MILKTIILNKENDFFQLNRRIWKVWLKIYIMAKVCRIASCDVYVPMFTWCITRDKELCPRLCMYNGTFKHKTGLSRQTHLKSILNTILRLWKVLGALQRPNGITWNKKEMGPIDNTISF